MKSRRDALKALIVAAAAAHSAQAQHEHGTTTIGEVKKPEKPAAFTGEQFALTAVLTDLIIPRSDTPGASDAGVPLILDAVAAKNAAFKKQWLAGLQWLNQGRDFKLLTHDQQVAILTPGGKFFTLAKDATIDAYYSTREGLMTELGWNANTFLTEFKGCTHPEHQA